MKICVIGAGALGTFYSAMMAAAGEDVTLICREKDAGRLKNGVVVTGAIEATARPAIATKPVLADIVFVTVKSYDVADAVKDIQTNPATLVVVVHNGLGSDEVAIAALGPCRVATGISYSGITYLEPGKVAVAGYTETVIGSADPEARDRLDLALFALNHAGLKARIADDIRTVQWEKLFANVGINAITAITGLNNGMLLEVPALKDLVSAAVREAALVAAASGIRTHIDPLEQTYKVIRETSRNRSSMLQDVSKGKRTEIDVLNGRICELGRKYGVQTPVNEALAALVKGLEKRSGH